MSDRSYDAVLGSRAAHTRAGGLSAGQILAAVALITLAGRRLEGSRRRRE